MNEGAKVFDDVAVFESARLRIDPLLEPTMDVKEAKELLRLCEGLCAATNGEDITKDLGLPFTLPVLGDGEFVLAKGLLRFCEAILSSYDTRSKDGV